MEKFTLECTECGSHKIESGSIENPYCVECGNMEIKVLEINKLLNTTYYPGE